MTAEGDPLLAADETEVEATGSGASPETIRVMILATTGLAILTAMSVIDGFNRPGYGLTGLLKAVLFVLLAVKIWVTRPMGSIFPEGGIRRRLAALFPLIALAAFGLDQLGAANHRAAQKQMDQRKEEWKQAMQRQHEAVDLAWKQFGEASKRYGEAIQAVMKTAEPVKLADGKPGHRHDPVAYQKMEDTQKEMQRAMERHLAEFQRLSSLGLEEPGRFGRP